MSPPESYRTLKSSVENVLYKERGSKFVGFAYPIVSEEDANNKLQQLWKLHPKATHICYAWQLGKNHERYRANDDGEPANSAGMPIYGQLQSHNLTFVLVAVVRYYGGTKLGVGGLIKAYREAADLALSTGKIVHIVRTYTVALSFEYDQLDAVMSLISEMNLDLITQEMQLSCKLKIEVQPQKLEEVQQRFAALPEILLEVAEN